MGVLPYAAGALVALLGARALRRRNRATVLVVSSSPRLGAYVACSLAQGGGLRRAVLFCLPADPGNPGEPRPYPLQEYVDQLCGEAGVQQIGGLEKVAKKRFDHLVLLAKSNQVAPAREQMAKHRVRARHHLAVYPGILGSTDGGRQGAAAGDVGGAAAGEIVEGYIPLAVEFAGGDGVPAGFVVHGADQPVLLAPGGEGVRDLLEGAGISARVTGEVFGAKLRDFLTRCMAGPLSVALGGLDYRELVSSHRPRMEELYHEAKEVLEGPYLEAAQRANLQETLFQTLDVLGFSYPSDWHDARAGVPLDLAGSLEHVQGAGLAKGCPTPATDALLRELSRA